MLVQERYTPVVVGVNTTVQYNSQQIGGFITVTAGTINIVDNNGTTVLSAMPVTAGVYYPLPMYLRNGSQNGTFTTAGGASGTLLV